MDLLHYVRAVRRRVRSSITRFGSFGSLEPVNLGFGHGKGTPIDRVYIEAFLKSHAQDITGCVLEIGDNEYTVKFGDSRVQRSEVLTYASNNSNYIVGRLESCPEIADNTYDCIILTQTLHYIFDMPAAVAELYRILKSGGVVLCTVPGLSQISRWDMDRWGDRWRLTTLSMKELFGSSAFGEDSIEVSSYGNVHAAVAFIEGVVAEKIKPEKLMYYDCDYQILVCAKVQKR